MSAGSVTTTFEPTGGKGEGAVSYRRHSYLLGLLSAVMILAQGCTAVSVREPASGGGDRIVTTGPSVGGSLSAPKKTPAVKVIPVSIGHASWYGPGFAGKKTASGEVFDDTKLTAAHKSLPLGTKVKVTNLENGRSVRVAINDRGPFVGNRLIDLSRAAAHALGMVENGVVRVRIEYDDEPETQS